MAHSQILRELPLKPRGPYVRVGVSGVRRSVADVLDLAIGDPRARYRDALHGSVLNAAQVPVRGRREY
jgi:hypothetical protein